MMLALELSTRRGSIALHDGDRVRAVERWDEPTARHPVLYDALPRLMKAGEAEWSKLTALAVGRGPGSFSGIRVALTAAQSIALPGRLPVYAMSSGEALALAMVEAGTAGSSALPPPRSERLAGRPLHLGLSQTIVVAGDARRGTIWYGVFHRHGHGVRQEGTWSLAPALDFISHVPAGALVVTSDSARLAKACGIQRGGDGVPPPRQERPEGRPPPGAEHSMAPPFDDFFPDATFVAALAWERIRSLIASDPLEPLYMHPAV